jgi:DNA repair protein RadC
MQARQEETAAYQVESEDAIIARALAILEARVQGYEFKATSPVAVREFLTVKLGALEHEVFTVIYLNCQNEIIGHEEMFRGTLTQTSVYPREVVKAVLTRNAAAVIFAHNHPSGTLDPSRADEMLTNSLKQTLSMIDVRVLDHFIIAGGRCASMAEKGLI